jgi:hypothetical protein
LDIDTSRGASDHASATLGSGDDDAMATRIVLTYADLVAMPADGKRYELHEGEIYMTAAPRPRHQQVVGNLYMIWRRTCGDSAWARSSSRRST